MQSPTDQQEPGPSEGELIRRFAASDQSAYHALVGPHVASMHALALRILRDPGTADDAVQEAMIRALHGLADFRGDASLRTWLLRIVARLASEPRRFGRRAEQRPLDFELPDRVGPAPLEAAIGRELSDRLEEAIERLPPRQRSALHLRAAEGFDYERIAAVLDCTRGAARMLVLEARRKVMARMGRFLEP